MKQNKLYQTGFVAAISIACSMIVSCEKAVEFEIDSQENKLVVNCLFGPEDNLNAVVSLSIDPLSTNDIVNYVDDATLKLYKNGTYIGDFTGSDSSYVFDESLFDANEGDIFRIEASAPGRETVSGETTIPTQVDFSSVEIIDTTYETIYYSIVDTLGNVIYVDSLVPYYVFELSFNDLPGVDYYSLEINYRDAFNESYTCFTTGDPVFVLNYVFGDEEQDEVTLCEDVFFSDLTFDGTTKTIQLRLLQIETDIILDPTFVFNLKHLSEDYYKYISTTDKQYNAGDDPFAEPVVVFSNIENGFGIFAGYSISTVEIEL